MKSQTRRVFLKQAGKYTAIGLTGIPLGAAFLNGCAQVEKVAEIGAKIGVDKGIISQKQADSLRKSTKAVARSFEEFTPEQEYYIGRTVGAQILAKYRPYNDQASNYYINQIGQTLALGSKRPATFGGYHFLIQNTNEINALAAPGGLIFVTRGLLRCCPNEDAVAAVLAHEIGHVQHLHGLQAIHKSRVTTALTTIGAESAKTFGDKKVAELTQTFEESIGDITKTLINNGYSRGFEREADQAAITIMQNIGYNPNGLTAMLRKMEQRLKPGGLDFAKTHPTPASRIDEIEEIIGPYVRPRQPTARWRRFQKALGRI
jgi:beta-barrel assembly-enhancing protease